MIRYFIFFILCFLALSPHAVSTTAEEVNTLEIPLLIYVEDNEKPWNPPQQKAKTSDFSDIGEFAEFYMAPTGGPGQPATVFVTGSPSQHSALVFEGLELRDPSLPSGGANWSLLSALGETHTSPIGLGESRILQGSGSSGGLMLTLPESSNERLRLTLGAGYKRLSGAILWSPWQVPRDGHRWQSSLTWLRDAGWSAAQSPSDAALGRRSPGFDLDRTSELSHSSVYERLSENSTTKALVLLQKQKTQFDAGPGADDQNAEATGQSIGALVAHSQNMGKEFHLSISATSRWGERKSENLRDPSNMSQSQESTFHYNYQDAAVQLTKKKIQFWSKTLNLWTRAQVRSDAIDTRDRREFGAFATNESVKKRRASFSGAAGAKTKLSRLSMELETKWTKWESISGHAFTANSKIGVDVSSGARHKMWLYAVLNRAIHSPSLYQLHSNFGNQSLKPEKSNNIKIAVKRKQKNFTAEIAYTQKNLRNLIDFDFLSEKNRFAFVNKTSANINALQFLAIKPQKEPSRVFGSMHLTWLRAQSGDSAKQKLVRRPYFQGVAKLGYQFRSNQLKKSNAVKISYKLLGKRVDIDASGNRLEMKPVSRLDLQYEQPVSPRLTAGFTLGNLLDESRQITWGYQAIPRHVRVQINWQR